MSKLIRRNYNITKSYSHYWNGNSFNGEIGDGKNLSFFGRNSYATILKVVKQSKKIQEFYKSGIYY